jgi:hypothetical protein
MHDIHACMVPSWLLTQSWMVARWDHVAQKIRRHGVEGSINGVKNKGNGRSAKLGHPIRLCHLLTC